MAEWSNAHAWKACLPQGNQGSNPCPSAGGSPRAISLRQGLNPMRVVLVTFFCLTNVLLAATEQTLAKATREFLAGRAEAALATLAQAEKNGAPEGMMLSLRGSIYLEQGTLDEAMADFRAAIEKDATLFSPRLHLGDAFLRQKKWEDARSAYEEARTQTNLQISNEQLRYAILLTYLGAKDDAGAKTALANVVFPSQSPAYYFAQAASAFAHDNPADGMKWMKTAEKIFDEKQTAWFARPLYDFGWIKTKPPIVLD